MMIGYSCRGPIATQNVLECSSAAVSPGRVVVTMKLATRLNMVSAATIFYSPALAIFSSLRRPRHAQPLKSILQVTSFEMSSTLNRSVSLVGFAVTQYRGGAAVAADRVNDAGKSCVVALRLCQTTPRGYRCYCCSVQGWKTRTTGPALPNARIAQ